MGLACQPGPDRGVPYSDLVESLNRPADWLTYSGSYSGLRHSGLTEIVRENVSEIELLWSHTFDVQERMESTPIVVDGTMYVTTPYNDVVALDADTGREQWRYFRPSPGPVPLCCGSVNRGLAVLGPTLYMGTIDAHLVALDARNGLVRWDVEVADSSLGYSITGAPLAIADRVITGVGGSAFGIRGFIAAFNAMTGEEEWRFYTTPAPGEPGSQTWEGDSWKTGGAASWLTGSYDPTTATVFWGVGNPSPVFDGSRRQGDNLFANSVVALDAVEGTLLWYFQFTPHDTHDWDSNQIPVLVDSVINGERRRLVYWANRNGFFYVLDRMTGEFLSAVPFARQTWAEGIDPRGRPVRIPTSEPSIAGTVVAPTVLGATNWWSPSFSPLTGLFYVQAWDATSVYRVAPGGQYEAGQLSWGGDHELTDLESSMGAVRAIDPSTGEIAWAYEHGDLSHAGVLSTAGNIVFSGSDGRLFALDAETGAVLWTFRVNKPVHASPIAYGSASGQKLAIMAGDTLYAFGLR